MPTVKLSKENLNMQLLDILVLSNIITSKSEGKRLIEQNGISINNQKQTDCNKTITNEDLKENYIIVQKGKKVFVKIIFE